MTDTPKAYIVSEAWVTDPEVYGQYGSQAQATLDPFGGRFIVRGGNGEAIAGEAPSARLVIIEFPSREAALGWRASDEYQRILKLREASSTSRVYVVDGVAP